MNKWVILAALLGLYLLLCFKAAFYICARQNKLAAEANYTVNIVEDGCGWCAIMNKVIATTRNSGNPQDALCGWCSLTAKCAKRCVCHDECGPWCVMWRKLVYNGIIKDTGVYKLTTAKVLKHKWLNEEWKKEKEQK